MSLTESWYEEKRSAFLYEVLAKYDANILHQKLFKDLHASALKQAGLWENRIRSEGGAVPQFKPDLRTKFIVYLVRIFGTDNMHRILSAMKVRGMSVFLDYHDEHRHRSLSSANNLRAAIFGVNDGLVSNLSLILGVAAANADVNMIILAGTAGLLAGACSMGAGEYISVRSQREVYEYQIAIEKKELEEYPEEEMEELTLIYEARGIPKDEAGRLAKLMVENPKTALDTLAREELGLNPDDLVSPIGAMLASFFSFAFGAFIPLVPFLYFAYPVNMFVSIAITGVSLFLIGMLVSLYTDRSAILSGFRMLLIAAIAGSLTYGIGYLMGVN